MIKKVNEQEFYKTIEQYDYDVQESNTGNTKFSVNKKLLGFISHTNWGNEYFIVEDAIAELTSVKFIKGVLTTSVICSIITGIFEYILISKVSPVSLVPLAVGLSIFLYKHLKG